MVTQKQLIKQSPISSVYDSQIGSQEEIVERAKQVLFLECLVILLKLSSLSSYVLYIHDTCKSCVFVRHSEDLYVVTKFSIIK